MAKEGWKLMGGNYGIETRGWAIRHRE